VMAVSQKPERVKVKTIVIEKKKLTHLAEHPSAYSTMRTRPYSYIAADRWAPPCSTATIDTENFERV